MSAWHLVAHLSELLNEGDFVCLPIGIGFEIAVMVQNGDIVAFDNRCPHRGARIFHQLRGNRPAVCGYHGRCARAADVRRLRLVSVGEFLFVRDEPPARDRSIEFVSVSDITGSLIDGFLFEAPPLRLHSSIQRVYDCDWKVAVENALDSEHIPHVHGATLAKLGLRRAGVAMEADGSSIEVFNAAEPERLDRIDKVFTWRQHFDYTHAFLGPFAAVSSTRGWTYSMQHYVPRTDGRTNFISRLFVQKLTAAGATHLFAGVAAMNRRVFDEDAEICAQVPAGFGGQLGPRDDRIAHFRAAHAAAVAA